MTNEILRNLFRLLTIAWRRRYTLFLPMFIMPVVGLIISFLAPKYYEAHTTILLQDTSQLNPVLEDFAVSTNLEERQAALKILLKSRKVLEAVARDVNYIDEDSDKEEVDEQVINLSQVFSIVFGGDLVKIYCRTENREDIELLLNTVTKHFLKLVMSPSKSWQETSASFLKSQVERQREALSNSEKKLADYKSKNALELPELHKANVTRLTELRQLLMEKNTELAGAKAAMKEFDGNLSQTNPVIGRLEEKIVNTRAHLSMLRSRYTDKHSKVQASIRELKRMESERHRIISESKKLNSEDVQRLWNLAASTSGATSDPAQGQTTILASQLQAVQEANAKVTSLENEVKSIHTQSERLQKKVQDFAEIERTLVELERDLNIKKKLYDDFHNRYVMAQVTGDLSSYEEAERVQIIDKPFTPSNPNKLPASLFAIAGLFAGLGIGTGLAAIAEISDTSLRLQDTIEKMAGIPVLARLPAMPQAPALTYDASRDRFTEEQVQES
ncbi:MAG: GumC family protein [Endozoicomonas sp.]